MKKEQQFLMSQINNNNLNHGYLLLGPEGSGKLDVGLKFSQALLCENENRPCGKCNSCKKFINNSHPDFKIIEPVNNIIRLEQIGEIIRGVKNKPFQSEKKIFLINQADLMNLQSQNSLLKTLEEPPNFMVIILITDDYEKLLDTVISRCEIIKFKPIDEASLLELLADKAFTDLEKKFLINISMGNKRLLEALIKDEEYINTREKLLKIIDRLLNKDKTAIYDGLDLFEDFEEIDFLFQTMIYFFRDILIYKETKNKEIIINIDMIDMINEHLGLSIKSIGEIITEIEFTRDNIDKNVNFPLSIELMYLKIWEEI